MKSTNQKYRLGLDLGTNSIGWAMLALNERCEPYKIIDSGVRIFSDGRNPKDGEPLAVARRVARGMRRRRDRFLARKTKLMNYLVKIGLMPKNELERKKLELLNPYQLRTEALERELLPHKLGRAIFHLNQRRGFKSNRKEVISDEKEKSKTKEAEDLLKRKITEANSRTIGEFLYTERLLKEKSTRAKPGDDGLYPTRDLYEKELDEIVKIQSQFQKNISHQNWQEIKNIIFYQRDLKPQRKGVCQLINHSNPLKGWAKDLLDNQQQSNPKSKGLPRACLALPSYQRFRILSEVSNLRIVDPNGVKIVLKNQEKQIIIDILRKQKSVTFPKLRKSISDKENNYDTDDFKFNFESDRRKNLTGNETEILLSKPENFGEKWFKFDLAKQDEIVEFILEAKKLEEILEKALEEWGLNQEQAQNISKLTPNDFKSGIGNLCKEILQNLSKEMAQEYCRYDEAIRSLLGFSHSSSKTLEEINQQKLGDSLPYYGKILQTSTVPVEYGSIEEVDCGRIANPTVHVALNQLQKVINDLIKEYGNPEEINVELARDLKMSKDEKKQTEDAQSKNQKDNERFAKELLTLHQRDNYDNRLKFKLWEELAKANNGIACCPYSGKTIGKSDLFKAEIEIEHILPWSKTLDDSFANKIIAFRLANQDKGDKSPYNAFGLSPKSYDYEAIKTRTESLPRNKRWRFLPNAMEKFSDENNFLERQLNDTRYLSRIAKQYLAHICKENRICVTNGKLTSLLRHSFGLNTVLNKEGNQKTRHDHRHHAIDAIIVAMTDRSTLKKVATAKNYYHKVENNNFAKISEKFEIPKPWENFRKEADEVINKIIISHKLDHGINGRLHEETNYGILENPVEIIDKKGNKKQLNVVYRKALSSLNKDNLRVIRDKRIKKELQEKLANIEDKKEIEKILSEFGLKDGNKFRKVKNVRILKPEASIVTILHPTKNPKFKKGVVPGANHHIAIWQLPKNIQDFSKLKNNPWLARDKSYAVTGVSYFDINSKESNKLKPHPAAKLLAKIHNGDLIKISEDGEEFIIKAISLKPSNSQLVAVKNNETGNFTKRKKDKNLKVFYISFSNFKSKNLTKIKLNNIGKIIKLEPIFS